MKRLLRTFLFVSLGIAVAGVGHSGAALNPGDILVVDFSAQGGTGAVITVDPNQPDGANQTLLSSNQFFKDPFGIVVDSNGRIFVADGTAQAVIEVDNMTGAQNIVHVGAPFVSPIGLAVGIGDDLWVADAAVPAVFTVNKNTGVVALQASGAPLVSPFDVALNKFGTVYVLDRVAGTNGTVFELPGLTALSTGGSFAAPFGLTIDQGAPFFPANEPGGIYVADRAASSAIFVDANTGAQTPVSQGQNFSAPGGVTAGAWPLFPTPFYVADFGSRAVIQFDPAVDPTANQSVVSSGQLFVNPVRLTVVPEQPVQTEEKTWGSIKGQYR